MPETVTFDHYAVLQRDDGSLYELGRGAMGITYKAFDQNLRIPVALKVINSTYLNSTVARQRFVREARAAAKLRHRHVASVFHLAIEGETMFYAMEFIDGETVDALIKRQGPLAPVLALQIVDQVARALNAAQVHGLVHRDIKPANLMLISEDDELTVKVIDFGLAKTLTPGEEDAATVSQGGFVGTPHFASPEQLEEGEIDVRSDIYSLGVTLWYMLAGQTPFAGSMAQVMSQHLGKPPPFERLSNLPAPVSNLLRRMLEKDRAARPQTPSELRLDIEKALVEVRSNGVTPLAAAAEAENFVTVLQEVSAPAAETTFEVGTVVAGRYKITARLGDTNTGVVFRGERIDDALAVRLLVLHRELTSEPATYTQIEREVEKVVPVAHANLLRVYGLETIETTSFIALEWTEGFSLLELLRARRELEAVEVLRLLEQAAAGADHALANDLKRLDLALHQVFIHFAEPIEKTSVLHHPVNGWPAFTVKLNPLGITRELSASETWGGQQTMVDRPAQSTIVASEQARAIQALGAVVYELLGGTLSPLASSSSLGFRYTPLANLSEQGNEALRHALAPVPPYPNAAGFHRALAEVDDLPMDSFVLPPTPPPPPVVSVSSRPAAKAPPAIPAPPPLPPHRQSSPSSAPLAIAAMLVALLLLGGGIYVFVLPLLKPGQGAIDPKPGSEIVERDDHPGGESDIATPPPATPIPEPKPLARTDTLKVAVNAADDLENTGQWADGIRAWVNIAREYPEFPVGKVRAEQIIERLRGRSVEVNRREFSALRDAMTDAAKADVIAAMLFLGEHLVAEPKESFLWFSAAADHGHVPAIYKKAKMLLYGTGVEKDLEAALESFRAAADQGFPAAKTDLGLFYRFGTNVGVNPRKAVAYFKEAADLGDARAMNSLGDCYHYGIGVPAVDNQQAFEFFTKAKDLNYTTAFGNLAVFYLNGDEPVERDDLRALKLIQQGVAMGDDFCLFLYAKCLEGGRGVKEDVVQARSFYIRAAEAGSTPAAEWCRKKKASFKEPPDFRP